MHWPICSPAKRRRPRVQTDEDAVPDAGPSITRPGDVWLCGNHRVICGDSTDADTYDALMADEMADMVFTDPPYNVNYANTAKDKMRGNGSPDPERQPRRWLPRLPVGGTDAHVGPLSWRHLRGHVILRTRRPAVGLSHCRRQVVDLHHLGEAHLHARVMPTISGSSSRSCTAGQPMERGTGAVRATRATSGTSRSRTRTICTRP